MSIERINPDTMYKNSAFTQVATVSSASKLVYVGGQNGVNKEGRIVGNDLATQTEQTYKNIVSALAAAGATMHDVFKMTIYIVQGQDVREGFAAFQKMETQPVPPPTISVIIVAGLSNPDFLIEIEAVAAV